MKVEKGYEVVADILQQALDQAQSGKGKERHGHGLPFTEQKIMAISRALRTDGGLAYQVEKKIQEGREFDNLEQLERELFGAIIYTVAMIIYHREVFAAKAVEAPAASSTSASKGFDMHNCDNWQHGDTVLYVGVDNARHTTGREYQVQRVHALSQLHITTDYSHINEPPLPLDKETAEKCFQWVDSSDKTS